MKDCVENNCMLLNIILCIMSRLVASAISLFNKHTYKCTEIITSMFFIVVYKKFERVL